VNVLLPLLILAAECALSAWPCITTLHLFTTDTTDKGIEQ
jgi:hypothetical protein